MNSNNFMAEYMRNYRERNKEFYEKEKANYKSKYQNDPEYKEHKKRKALERYYRMKEQHNQISVN